MSFLNSNFFKNSILFFVSIIAALFLGEIVLRIILPPWYKIPDELLLRPDPVLGHVLIPNAIPIHDGNGFKNPMVPAKADIVALGDSMTYGINNNLEQSWPSYLGNAMNMSVYNMGVGGYGPIQYYALTEKALSFNPKFIIVGLNLGNELFDAYNLVYNKVQPFGPSQSAIETEWKDLRFPEFVNDKPYPPSVLGNQDFKFESIRIFLRKNLLIYDFFASKTYPLRESLGLSKKRDLSTDDWTTTEINPILAYQDNPKIDTLFWINRNAIGLDLNNKNIQEGLRLTLDMLGRMQNRVKVSDSKLVIIVIPEKAAVYEKILGDKVKLNETFVEVIKNENTIRDTVLSFCKGKGISCFDLRPGLEEALSKNIRIFSKSSDGHPLSGGYEVFAKLIADYIYNL